MWFRASRDRAGLGPASPYCSCVFQAAATSRPSPGDCATSCAREPTPRLFIAVAHVGANDDVREVQVPGELGSAQAGSEEVDHVQGSRGESSHPDTKPALARPGRDPASPDSSDLATPLGEHLAEKTAAMVRANPSRWATRRA